MINVFLPLLLCVHPSGLGPAALAALELLQTPVTPGCVHQLAEVGGPDSANPPKSTQL